MQKPKGFILWEGPSPLTGAPIVAVATLESSNSKTGNMIQVWIIRSDMTPSESVKTGQDSAQCGSCSHRGVLQPDGSYIGRTCYVKYWEAPQTVFRAYKRGSYPHAFTPDGHLTPSAAALFTGREIRLGAYGEAALIPERILSILVTLSSGRTGYTQLWRRPQWQWARHYLHASCSSVAEHHAAKAAGWQTYTVIAPGAAPPPKVHACPATGPRPRIQCRACLGCSGTSGRDAWIEVHGAKAAHFVPARPVPEPGILQLTPA